MALFGFGRKNKQPDVSGILSAPAVGREKKPNAEGYYKVRCPYCLEEFEPWEMEFRAAVDTFGTRAAETRSKSSARDRMRDDENSPFGGSRGRWNQPAEEEHAPSENAKGTQGNYFAVEPDEKLRQFHENVHKMGGAAVMGKVLSLNNTEGDISRVKFHNAKEPVSFEQAQRFLQERKVPVDCVWDKFGHMTDNRVCPHCHNKMADRAGVLPSYVICFFGNTSCGKTVYKIRLLNELYANHALLPGRPVMVGTYYTGETIDGQDTQNLGMLYGMTFGEATRSPGQPIVKATDVEYIEPITLTLTRNGQELALVTFFDFPGEAIWGDQEQHQWFVDRMKEVLMYIDGIIFLLDPSMLDTLRRHLPEEFCPQTRRDGADVQTIAKREAKPTTVLQEFTNNYLSGGGQLDVPMAIVYSKADLFRELIERYRSGEITDERVTEMMSELMAKPRFLTNWIEPDRPGRSRRDHTSVDISNILEAERELKRFVIDPVLEGMLDSQFRRGVLFAASAVGAPVEFDGEGANVPEAAGIRITEPLEYLLWMFGLVENAPINDSEKMSAARLKDLSVLGGR